MQEYLKLLGWEMRDRVTGFSGVVTSMCFDLYGCVQAAVQPKHDAADKDSKVGQWFDVKRLEKTGGAPVMEQPVFNGPGTERGPAEKPARPF